VIGRMTSDVVENTDELSLGKAQVMLACAVTTLVYDPITTP